VKPNNNSAIYVAYVEMLMNAQLLSVVMWATFFIDLKSY
jgi:hypothetical protein